MKKPINNLDIKLMDITVRTKNVLTALGINTIEELGLSHTLETLPSVGTVVKYYPFARVSLVYCKKVNEEVRQMLFEHCNVPLGELENVGA